MLYAGTELRAWAEATEAWAPHERGFARLLEQEAHALRALAQSSQDIRAAGCEDASSGGGEGLGNLQV